MPTDPTTPTTPPETPIDPRVALAAERTLLAWIRTGLSLMGFGFVVARFGLLLRTLTLHDPTLATGSFSRWMGIALVVLGLLINLFAALQHTLLLSDRSTFDARRRLSGWCAVLLASLLALLGLIMAVYLAQTR